MGIYGPDGAYGQEHFVQIHRNQGKRVYHQKRNLITDRLLQNSLLCCSVYCKKAVVEPRWLFCVLHFPNSPLAFAVASCIIKKSPAVSQAATNTPITACLLFLSVCYNSMFSLPDLFFLTIAFLRAMPASVRSICKSAAFVSASSPR
ncbi:hypothetical protein SDC9_177646 [bioreactor metagenome]|uniref:Uncharacterized protein n=1 Tax=bioreactor metagenome TaxID=1076179 RepID=A0A645GTM7_9ZZZZ